MPEVSSRGSAGRRRNNNTENNHSSRPSPSPRPRPRQSTREHWPDTACPCLYCNSYNDASSAIARLVQRGQLPGPITCPSLWNHESEGIARRIRLSFHAQGFIRRLARMLTTAQSGTTFSDLGGDIAASPCCDFSI